jgi:hypothetical protein
VVFPRYYGFTVLPLWSIKGGENDLIVDVNISLLMEAREKTNILTEKEIEIGK